MQTVDIIITARVKARVTLAEGETVADLKNRSVDIYLHGAGDNGWLNKDDLGTSFHKIEVVS